MKKKPPVTRRPQDVMARFDRLLASMAPKPEPPAKKPLAPRGSATRRKNLTRPVRGSLGKGGSREDAK